MKHYERKYETPGTTAEHKKKHFFWVGTQLSDVRPSCCLLFVLLGEEDVRVKFF